ncbi:hypothetical protein GCM10009577_04980 [Streptomyces javensis]
MAGAHDQAETTRAPGEGFPLDRWLDKQHYRRRLGAGRAREEDAGQAGAGVGLHAKSGDTVAVG